MRMLIAAAALTALAAAPSSDDVTVKVGSVAPDFEATWINHSSSKGSLSDLGGRLVFIEAWRTW
ncbi:MAG: hypothetical protein ACT4PU_11765 [Planctomycetota bacterium]